MDREHMHRIQQLVDRKADNILGTKLQMLFIAWWGYKLPTCWNHFILNRNLLNRYFKQIR